MKHKVRPPSCIYKIGTSYYYIDAYTVELVSGLNKLPLVPCNDKSFYHMSLGCIARVIQLKLQRMVSRFDLSGFKSYKTTKIDLSNHKLSFFVFQCSFLRTAHQTMYCCRLTYYCIGVDENINAFYCIWAQLFKI